MSAATAPARRSTTVAGRPGRAGRGPEPLAAASITSAINTRLRRRCRAPGRGPQERARDNGGLALYRATAVTTLRDQLPNACADFCQPVLRPDGGEASNRRLVEHEEPAEIEPPLSKIITSQGVPGGACASCSCSCSWSASGSGPCSACQLKTPVHPLLRCLRSADLVTFALLARAPGTSGGEGKRKDEGWLTA